MQVLVARVFVPVIVCSGVLFSRTLRNMYAVVAVVDARSESKYTHGFFSRVIAHSLTI